MYEGSRTVSSLCLAPPPPPPPLPLFKVSHIYLKIIIPQQPITCSLYFLFHSTLQAKYIFAITETMSPRDQNAQWSVKLWASSHWSLRFISITLTARKRLFRQLFCICDALRFPFQSGQQTKMEFQGVCSIYRVTVPLPGNSSFSVVLWGWGGRSKNVGRKQTF